jgi:hypothetical protein
MEQTNTENFCQKQPLRRAKALWVDLPHNLAFVQKVQENPLDKAQI